MYDARWYDGPPPPPQRPRPKRGRGLVLFLAALAVAVASVGTWVLLNRLSDDVLTVVATVACAAGVSLPGLLLALVVLVKRAENNGRQPERTQPVQPQMTQPTLFVVPPQMLPPAQGYPQTGPATWETAAGPRHFTVVGAQGGDAIER